MKEFFVRLELFMYNKKSLPCNSYNDAFSGKINVIKRCLVTMCHRFEFIILFFQGCMSQIDLQGK